MGCQILAVFFRAHPLPEELESKNRQKAYFFATPKNSFFRSSQEFFQKNSKSFLWHVGGPVRSVHAKFYRNRKCPTQLLRKPKNNAFMPVPTFNWLEEASGQFQIFDFLGLIEPVFGGLSDIGGIFSRTTST